ncbi:hypothetical protein EYF80_024698 [Liparis tanakae]|uniref:Uncharacterized protein n=1 Tax=Liparis tanakae TaxID=230148 RepID=A0A4Z2HGU0_9TELE|nr:hypothetical protein EYF80_024698 [Liparis tanakae]
MPGDGAPEHSPLRRSNEPHKDRTLLGCPGESPFLQRTLQTRVSFVCRSRGLSHTLHFYSVPSHFFWSGRVSLGLSRRSG